MKSRLKKIFIGVGAMGILLLNQPAAVWAEEAPEFTEQNSDDMDVSSETGKDSRQNGEESSETRNGVQNIQNDNGMKNNLSEYNTGLQGNSEAPDVSDESGWKEINGHRYYYDKEGKKVTDWHRIQGIWYYFDAEDTTNPGVMVSNEKRWIRNAWYFFDEDGRLKTGWVKRDEGWYYTNPGGAVQTGWQRIGSFWYYLDGDNVDFPGIMISGERKWIKNAWFCFETNGAMKSGWVKRDEGWYYTNPGGAIQTGWQKVGDYWYYLDGSDAQYPGLMLHDVTVEINGLNYTFLSNGAMKTGWSKENGDWYYYDNNSGQTVSDWKNIRGLWYYFDPNNGNKMVTEGWYEIKGACFYIETSGAMATGWKSLGGNWYYFGSNGAMRTGWQQIGMYWYYFYYENDSHGGSYGAMAKNTIIEGKYVVHANGAYIRSRNKLGWQNPVNYPQVSSMSVALPSYCTGYFTYVTPSRISIYATKQDCINAFIARAYEYLGTRFIEPWSSWPGDAVDCSGLVLQCLYATGMDLGMYNPYNHRWMPSQTYNSMNWYHNNTFMPISVNSIQRGDLLYYRNHVAIYLGNGQIIDSWPGQGVSIRSIGSRGTVIGAARPFV